MIATTQSQAQLCSAAQQRCGWWCSVAGLLAVFALILQLLSPGLVRASDGEWIEICSELGPVMMQIDFSADETDQNKPCPKCETCTLCAAAIPAAPGFGASAPANKDEPRTLTLIEWRTDLSGQRYQRPQSRGPPTATPDMTDRARYAPMAMSRKAGDTPWT